MDTTDRDTFMPGEASAIRRIVASAAALQGEDIPGLILKTGGFHDLEDQDGAVVRLAHKLTELDNEQGRTVASKTVACSQRVTFVYQLDRGRQVLVLELDEEGFIRYRFDMAYRDVHESVAEIARGLEATIMTDRLAGIETDLHDWADQLIKSTIVPYTNQGNGVFVLHDRPPHGSNVINNWWHALSEVAEQIPFPRPPAS